MSPSDLIYRGAQRFGKLPALRRAGSPAAHGDGFDALHGQPAALGDVVDRQAGFLEQKVNRFHKRGIERGLILREIL